MADELRVGASRAWVMRGGEAYLPSGYVVFSPCYNVFACFVSCLNIGEPNMSGGFASTKLPPSQRDSLKNESHTHTHTFECGFDRYHECFGPRHHLRITIWKTILVVVHEMFSSSTVGWRQVSPNSLHEYTV